MAERTMKEQKDAVAYELQKYLPVPSPFSVWGTDGGMELQVSRYDNMFRTASEIELSVLRGTFARSDYYYLLAASCFQFATMSAMCALVRFWKRRDVVEASEEGREQLIIPSIDSSHEQRIRGLCRKGVMTRYNFFLNPDYFKVPGGEEAARNGKVQMDFFRANSHGAGIASAALEKRMVAYDLRTAFFSEDETLRWVQNSVLTASFLQLPYIKDVKFLYKVTVGRQKVQLMSYLSAENSVNPKHNCDLILESFTLRTNEKVVTLRSRKEAFIRRLADLLRAMKELELKNNRAQFLVLCVEDFDALVFLQKFLKENTGKEHVGRILVTTGTVLYARQTSEPGFEKNMETSFLEFTGTGFTGVTNYYFLHDSIVG